MLSRKSKMIILAVIAILVALLLLGGIFLMMRGNETPANTETSLSGSEDADRNDTPELEDEGEEVVDEDEEPVVQRGTITFPTDSTDMNSRYSSFPFWDEVESRSLSITCTDRYFRLGTDPFYTQNNPSVEMTNSTLLALVSELGSELPGATINRIQTCDVYDGRKLIVYAAYEGEDENTYVGFLEGTTLRNKVTIDIGSGVYYGCNNIIALTEDHEVYLGCAGGDGGWLSLDVYLINLSETTSDPYYGCEYLTGEPDNCRYY